MKVKAVMRSTSKGSAKSVSRAKASNPKAASSRMSAPKDGRAAPPPKAAAPKAKPASAKAAGSERKAPPAQSGPSLPVSSTAQPPNLWRDGPTPSTSSTALVVREANGARDNQMFLAMNQLVPVEYFENHLTEDLNQPGFKLFFKTLNNKPESELRVSDIMITWCELGEASCSWKQLPETKEEAFDEIYTLMQLATQLSRNIKSELPSKSDLPVAIVEEIGSKTSRRHMHIYLQIPRGTGRFLHHLMEAARSNRFPLHFACRPTTGSESAQQSILSYLLVDLNKDLDSEPFTQNVQLCSKLYTRFKRLQSRKATPNEVSAAVLSSDIQSSQEFRMMIDGKLNSPVEGGMMANSKRLSIGRYISSQPLDKNEPLMDSMILRRDEVPVNPNSCEKILVAASSNCECEVQHEEVKEKLENLKDIHGSLLNTYFWWVDEYLTNADVLWFQRQRNLGISGTRDTGKSALLHCLLTFIDGAGTVKLNPSKGKNWAEDHLARSTHLLACCEEWSAAPNLPAGDLLTYFEGSATCIHRFGLRGITIPVGSSPPAILVGNHFERERANGSRDFSFNDEQLRALYKSRFHMITLTNSVVERDPDLPSRMKKCPHCCADFLVDNCYRLSKRYEDYTRSNVISDCPFLFAFVRSSLLLFCGPSSLLCLFSVSACVVCVSPACRSCARVYSC